MRTDSISKADTITDYQVCKAYQECRANNEIKCWWSGYNRQAPGAPVLWPHDILASWTGQALPVCYEAMQRAAVNGYIFFTVSLRAGWLTEKGRRLIALAEDIGPELP